MDTHLKARGMAPMGGTLTVDDGDGEQQSQGRPPTNDDDRFSVTVGTELVKIGRDPLCNIVLDDAAASFYHASARATPYGTEIEDANSKNGTYVNGIRIRSVLLEGPARIQCGDTVIHFEPARAGTAIPIEIGDDTRVPPLVGDSLSMRAVYRTIRRVAPTMLSVLIQGETGTGKELVAEAIHRESGRSGPFIVIDCTNIPVTLAESILFGHVKGSFTGAMDVISPFELAAGGTIFLDELGDLPPAIQPKLLRALQKREIVPVGSREPRPRPIDVRVVAATRTQLTKAINDGSFRSDLYFRIAITEIALPPLRDHIDDIDALVRHFATEMGYAEDLARVPWESFDALRRHKWVGNVRELQNRVEAAFALCRKGPIDFFAHSTSAPEWVVETPEASVPERGTGTGKLGRFREERLRARDAFDRDYWARIRDEHGGNIAAMAQHAGLSRTQARAYVKRFRLPVIDD